METFDKKCRKTCYQSKKSGAGFTLIELLIAMAVGLVLLGAMYGVFTMYNKSFGTQEQIAEMQQSARASMDMMTREMRMAGYNPTGAAGFDGIPYNADSSTIDVYADLNNIPGIDNPVGSYEHITYSYDSANKLIRRNTNTGGGAQPFAENIQSVTFNYLNSAGNPTTTTANIRQIRITIIAMTARPDPAYTLNGGYRTYTLTSVIIPRNLGL